MSSIVYLIFKKCYLNQAKPGSRPLEIECVLKSCLKYTKATEHVATWVRNEKRRVFFLVLRSDFAFTPVRAFSTLYLEKRLRASFCRRCLSVFYRYMLHVCISLLVVTGDGHW